MPLKNEFVLFFLVHAESEVAAKKPHKNEENRRQKMSAVFNIIKLALKNQCDFFFFITVAFVLD